MRKLFGKLMQRSVIWLLFLLTILTSINLFSQSKKELHLIAVKSDSIIQEGNFQTFHENGRLKTKGYIIKKPYRALGCDWFQMRIGSWTTYFKNGNLKDSIVYDSLSRPLEKYFFNKKGICFYSEITENIENIDVRISSRQTFIKPLDFTRTNFDNRTGKIRSQAQFKNSKLHGKLKKYNMKGVLKKELVFFEGKKIREKK